MELNDFTEHEMKIQEKLKKYSLYDIPMHPIIIICNNKKFAVKYESILYFFDNLLDAIDNCFKLYFVFNLKYPTQCIKVWTFIQKYFYDMSVESDIKDGSLENFLRDFYH